MDTVKIRALINIARHVDGENIGKAIAANTVAYVEKRLAEKFIASGMAAIDVIPAAIAAEDKVVETTAYQVYVKLTSPADGILYEETRSSIDDGLLVDEMADGVSVTEKRRPRKAKKGETD
jgi:hypothetical protein